MSGRSGSCCLLLQSIVCGSAGVRTPCVLESVDVCGFVLSGGLLHPGGGCIRLAMLCALPWQRDPSYALRRSYGGFREPCRDVLLPSAWRFSCCADGIRESCQGSPLPILFVWACSGPSSSHAIFFVALAAFLFDASSIFRATQGRIRSAIKVSQSCILYLYLKLDGVLTARAFDDYFFKVICDVFDWCLLS